MDAILADQSQLLESGKPATLKHSMLVPLVYEDLRRLAHHYLQKQRLITLCKQRLSEQAYLRLARHEMLSFENRAFFAVLATIMRQILVDYARNQHAAKRCANQMVWINRSSRSLGECYARRCPASTKLDSRQGRIVELRFFGGLSIEETAGSGHLCRHGETSGRRRGLARKQLVRGSLYEMTSERWQK